MSQPFIDLQHISKSFDGELVLDDLNLSIRENSFVTLLGPSGCGKTTTLRILGGFTTPDTGKVIVGGRHRDTANQSNPASSRYLFQRKGPDPVPPESASPR